MKKLHVFHYHERLQAGMLKDILACEGVICALRNAELAAAVGEIPFIECCPELWVVDDEAWPRARMLLDAWLQNDLAAPPWECPRCHEESEGHFGACWSCGASRGDG